MSELDQPSSSDNNGHTSGPDDLTKAEADRAVRLDHRYMRMAHIWAENSYCQRRKVGAILVKDKMIISDGYNGTPSGFENVCEDETGRTKMYVLHAEANAITKVAKSSNSSQGSTLYVTSSPCIECAKLIIQSGIQRVVFSEFYRDLEGLDLLSRAGVAVDRVVDEPETVAPATSDGDSSPASDGFSF